jgi:IS30 family transposase
MTMATEERLRSREQTREGERRRRVKSLIWQCVALINNLLEDYLSPEQISGMLMLEKEVTISHETIYRYV